MHLLMAGKLASLALFLPCGALSVLRRGQRKQPRRTPRALRAASSLCALFWCAWRCCVPVLFVVSGTSALCSSPRLTFLEGLPGVTASRLPACSRGVCHSGSLLVLSSGFENLPWDTPSTSVCLPVKGREEAERRPGHCFGFTSQVSACLATHLLSRPSTEEKKSGLESLVVNDLLCARPWKAGPAWSWDRPEHINVLEARAYLKVLRDLAAEGGDLRYTHVVDSSVTLGAAAKGRSSTRALRGLLLRNAALQIAGGLYPTVAFGPTRLNVADDPTRNVRLRAPCKHSLLELLKPQDLYLACSFKQLRRPTANWLRLACLLVGFKSPRPLVGFIRALGAPWRKERTESLLAGSPAQRPDPPLPSTGFDATLGYPGEGQWHLPNASASCRAKYCRTLLCRAAGLRVLTSTPLRFRVPRLPVREPVSRAEGCFLSSPLGFRFSWSPAGLRSPASSACPRPEPPLPSACLR